MLARGAPRTDCVFRGCCQHSHTRAAQVQPDPAQSLTAERPQGIRLVAGGAKTVGHDRRLTK